MDIVLIDTAGRLHTRVNLMEELKKIRRVIQKEIPDGPHKTLLILDATMGQNAISQARIFHEAMEINGIILTKLDGTAKGGIIVGICNELKIPIEYIGIGEKADDLQPFNPDEFVRALF
jgi:fused signal recognition particle receptor